MNYTVSYDTVSWDIAEKLFEAGWNKPCHFSRETLDHSLVHSADSNKEECFIPAPQLHEILEELPSEIIDEGEQFCLVLDKVIDGYESYFASEAFIRLGLSIDSNPHDCIAHLYIWCKENGYLSDNQE